MTAPIAPPEDRGSTPDNPRSGWSIEEVAGLCDRLRGAFGKQSTAYPYLAEAAAALESIARERDDYKDDSLRLHREKCDALDQCTQHRATIERLERELQQAKEAGGIAAIGYRGLQAERDRLREALRQIADEPDDQLLTMGRVIARAALAPVGTSEAV